MKRLLVQLEDAVHERLKRISFGHHRSMASIIREMVREGLRRPIPPAGRRREDIGAVAKQRSGKRR